MAYTDEQIKTFKEIIIAGLFEGKSLKKILENDESLPSRTRVYEWLNSEHEKYDESFRNNYAYAREESADIDVDKMEDLNQELRDKKIDPQTARVIADNLKWTAGRKKPKKYGDKLGLEHSGEIKTKPPVDLSKLSDKELKEYYKIQGKIEGE